MAAGEIKVLLIEDNVGDADYITELLSEPGSLRFHISTVDRLAAGVDFLNRADCDVIILDLTLPDSKGIYTFEKISGAAPNIPIIIITGIDNESIAAKTLQQGLQDYILKSNLSAELLTRSIRYAIDRKHAETQIRDTALRSRILSDISREIANVRLDPDLLLRTISKSIAMWIGDTCIIRILTDDGTNLRKAGIAHRDPDVEREMQAIVETAPHLPDEGLNGIVMRRGKSVIIRQLITEHVDDELRKECLRFYAKTGPSGVIMVPLIVEGTVIGTIAITRDTGGKPYCIEDLRLLESIADRAALAISNAKLYESVRKELAERKRIERALRESEEKYRSIVDGSIDGIVLVDEQGIVIEVNPGEERITGRKRSELIGKYIWDMQFDSAVPDKKNPERYEQVKALIKEILETGDISGIKEFPYQDMIRPDGTVRTIQSTISPIRTHKGFMLGGIVHDVTERKRSEEQMLKSLREKEALLKEVHHRVKNNMQIINSLLHLQSSHVDDEMARTILIDCQNRVKSMALIHEKLYMSSDLANVDFPEYLKSLVTNISSSYNIDPQRISIEVQAEELRLPIDAAIPCGLIVNELITNSVKHAFPDDRQGVIKVSLYCKDNSRCIVEVCDNGVGIREDLNIDSATTLGLQLVKILVGQINGSIEIKNDSGTAFKISFKNA
ncbi:histidine kinase dimerization/phosphoacceptor domain -containing protein [Methanocella sp. MCL-LM]|uniref:sensor histidine kinase n=1 Tax=Methanocella sp. MCL-LM TaxID=3412035 RepID=UPI003C714A56